MQPYSFQRECIDSIYRYFSEHDGNPLLCLPTGSGKSVIQALFQREVLAQWPDQRILLLTHVRELVEQNSAKLLQAWPKAPLGIYSAGLRKREHYMPIVMASIQSVHNRADLLGRFDLIIIDECHLVPRSGTTMYRKFLSAMREINPAVKIIGMTATPFRLDSGYLHKGDDRIFTDIAYEISVRYLIDNGYLCSVVTKGALQKIDLTNVRTRAGEYAADDLDKAVHADGLTESAVREILKYGADRKSWLIFCSSVDHAQEIAGILNERVPTACLHSESQNDERARIVADIRSGRLKCVTNYGVLTTGFDAPVIDMIVFLRATKSASLYIQMVGRGMRLSPGKSNCLVLDFGANIERHGPVDAIDVSERRARKLEDGEKETRDMGKECPMCKSLISVFRRECDCGYQWPFIPADPKHAHTATDAAILTAQIQPVWYSVDKVYYRRHQKEGKSPSMRVEYLCGMKVFSTWVCVEHTCYARQKAVQWFQLHEMRHIPTTLAEAMNARHSYPTPSRIQVRKYGKFEEVVGYDFERKPDAANAAHSQLADDGDSTIVFDVPAVRRG